MNKNTKCFECKTPLTTRNATIDTSTIGRMCNKCYDYAMWENAHDDDEHDQAPVRECPFCVHEELITVVTGRKNISHATCTHERTSKGRAACRKANAK